MGSYRCWGSCSCCLVAQAENRNIQMMIINNVDFTEYDIEGDPAAGCAIFRPDIRCPASEKPASVIPGG